MRFWDSSAVVPLIVTQTTSARVDAWLRQDDGIVLWTLTSVEVVSAVRRLTREGAISADIAAAAEVRTDELLAASHVIVDLEGVKMQARRVLRLHALRAGDALQLAAAIEWSGGRPSGRVLHTFDEGLSSAARLEGFRVNDG